MKIKKNPKIEVTTLNKENLNASAYPPHSPKDGVMQFILHDFSPCVPEHTLYCHKCSGSLGLDQVAHYYKAEQLAHLVSYDTVQDVPL